MEQFLNATTTIGEMGIGYPKDEKGRDWYKTQSLFKEDTLKVCFDTKSRTVKSWHKDISFLYPSDGDSIVEVDYDESKLTYENQYTINEAYDDITVNETYETIKQMHTLKNKAESKINDLRIKVDEAEYGIIDDIEPTYKERLKAWLIVRKKVIEFDINSNDSLPQVPQF